MSVALVNIVICLSFVEVFSILWKETTISDYPFLVSLQNRVSGHVCTGTLIEASWVLTNDYCSSVLYSHKDTIIVAGQTNINMPFLSYKKSDIRVPNYHKKHYLITGTGSKHALSLYHFKKPFKLDRNIQVAKLPEKIIKELNLIKERNNRFHMVGWGKAENNSKVCYISPQRNSDILNNPLELLRETENRFNLLLMKVKSISFKLYTASVPVKTCKKTYENVTGYSLCIDSKDNFFTLVGQSGSPILCDGIVVGVMYHPVCTSRDTCIYTRTDSNMMWIRGCASSYNNLLFSIITYILTEICTVILY